MDTRKRTIGNCGCFREYSLFEGCIKETEKKNTFLKRDEIGLLQIVYQLTGRHVQTDSGAPLKNTRSVKGIFY